ncbi:MAG: Gfo/Idh/MocA family oxidoreductase [Anaerolineales bacterium]|nr:Gfo/Idh/MocA family oxidoreductase [Anaerolineales bacterium]
MKIGVLGVGRMGQRHCRVCANLRRVHLAGVYDTDEAQGRHVAQQYDTTAYTDVDALLAAVDAVTIATPTPYHFELTQRCLERGKHVLIEKPIAETLEQARALTEAAEASGLVVQVGHIERFNTAYMELKNVLETMTPLALNFRRLSASAGSNTDVDVVLDLMIHDANLVLDLLGEWPAEIVTYGLSVFTETVDHAVAQLVFPRGQLVTLTASRVTEHKVRSIEVTAREAYIECDLLNKSLLAHRQTIGEYLSHNGRGVKYRQESIVERIQIPMFESLFLELQHFVDCILDGKPSLVSARDGMQALELVTLIREQAIRSLASPLPTPLRMPGVTAAPVL